MDYKYKVKYPSDKAHLLEGLCVRSWAKIAWKLGVNMAIYPILFVAFDALKFSRSTPQSVKLSAVRTVSWQMGAKKISLFNREFILIGESFLSLRGRRRSWGRWRCLRRRTSFWRGHWCRWSCGEGSFWRRTSSLKGCNGRFEERMRVGTERKHKNANLKDTTWRNLNERHLGAKTWTVHCQSNLVVNNHTWTKQDDNLTPEQYVVGPSKNLLAWKEKGYWLISISNNNSYYTLWAGDHILV